MTDREGGPGSPDQERDDVLVPPVRRRRRPWRRDNSLFAGTLIAILVAAAGVGAWLWLGAGGDEADPSTSPSEATAPSSDTGRSDPSAAPSADTALDLPSLSASDELVRRVAADLSARPGWARWLATDDLVRDFVAAVVRISAGSSPAERLEILEPEGEFRVRESGGRTVVDPAGYARYDLPTAIVVSLDTEGTARLYRQLRPLFEEAHRELGFEDDTFDEAFARAVRTLLAVEVPEGPVEVVRDDGVYRFRDPRLESLSPAQKHLLRMGPDNARRVQSKLRELADAIGIRLEPEGAPSASS